MAGGKPLGLLDIRVAEEATTVIMEGLGDVRQVSIR
jgi:hypothetical protein